jgi:mono/diheme cytochrome c family protein
MRTVVFALTACAILAANVVISAEPPPGGVPPGNGPPGGGPPDRAPPGFGPPGIEEPAKANDVPLTGQLAIGKAVYDQWCASCHMSLQSGRGRFPPAGTYRLQQRYQGKPPAALDERTDLTPELIKTVVRRGLPIMTAIRKTEVTDTELDAIVAYLTRQKSK